MNRYRNLLFGLAAVQAGKVPAERLGMLAQESQQHGSADLGERLVAEGLISSHERVTINQLVDRQIEQHDGNMEVAVATLWQTLRVTPSESLQQSGGSLPPWSESLFSGVAPRDTRPGQTPAFGAPPAAQAASGLKTQLTGHSVVGFPSVLEAVREQPGRYREIRTVARGGMGRILLVHDASLCRDVAMKQLLPGAEDPELVSRFLREARVTGQLEHPGIVPVYELGYRTDDSLFYAMRLVRGRSLEEEIAKRPELVDRLGLLPHLLDLCQAIAYAHSRGVIHRDVKPLNVMIGEFGETVVIDWGIAKLRGMHDTRAGELREAMSLMRNAPDDATLQTTYGQTLGSPYYMPPEQAAGDPDAVDERSDVYALGAVLYAVLTGKPPYNGLSTREFLDRVGAFAPKPVLELSPKAPAELAAICIRAMAREPEKRYASARELAEELKRYLSGGLVNAYEYRVGELIKRFVRRHRAVLTTASLAVLALIGLAGWSYGRVSRERDFAREQQVAAETERGRAETARDQAEQARTTAETERVRAERELYFANIALAQRAAEEARIGQARLFLESAPAVHRDWEWAWLARSINEDVMTLKEGGVFAAFVDGGRLLATARDNGTIMLLDALQGTPVHTLSEKAGFGLALAGDDAGKLVAASTAKAVQVWETASGRELFRYNETEDPLSRHFIALSRDGRRLAALNSDKTLRLWTLGDAKPRLELSVTPHPGFGMWLSPDGGRLLLITAELTENGMQRQIQWVDTENTKLLSATPLSDMQTVHAAVFTPDGLLAAYALDDRVEIWNTKDWKLIRTISGQFALPDTLVFDATGNWLAMGATNGQVILWDRAADKEQHSGETHKDSIRALAFQPGGSLLASTSLDHTVRLWRLPDLTPAALLRGHDQAVFAAAFSPDGARLATCGFDGTTRLWDMTRESMLTTPESVCWHAASGKIAAGMQGAVALWDGLTGRRIAALDTGGLRVETIAFDRTGDRLAGALTKPQDASSAAAPPERRVMVWTLAGGKKTLDVAVEKTVDMLAFAGRDGSLVAIRLGSELRLLDMATGAVSQHISGVVDAALRPDGEEFAVCLLTEDNGGKPDRQIVARYAAATMEKIAESIVPTGFTAGLCYAPDGKRLALGALLLEEEDWRGGVYLWDLSDSQPPRWLQSHSAMVSAVAFSDDGAVLAAGGKNGGLSLWDPASGTKRWQVQGHGASIANIAFSPEGRRIATAGGDGRFKLWDAADGREVLTLRSVSAPPGVEAAPARTGFSAAGAWMLTLTEPKFAPPLMSPVLPDGVVGAEVRDAAVWEKIEAWKRAAFAVAPPATGISPAPGS